MKIDNNKLILLLLLLANVESKEENTDSNNHLVPIDSCSRDQSRLMRKILHDKLLKQVPNSSSKSLEEIFPSTCPFHPAHDVYLDQEQHKKETSMREWKCGYCGKMFRFEHYLDQHMSRKHSDALNNLTSICLGDLCPIFGCNTKATSFAESMGRGLNAQAWINTAFNEHAVEKCNQVTVDKYQFRCKSLMRRCFDGMVNAKGVPLDSLFEASVCDQMHCSRGELKAGMKLDSETQESQYFVSWLVQVVLVVFIAVFVCGYALFADLGWRSVFRSDGSQDVWRRNQTALKRAVRDHHTSSQRGSSFISSAISYLRRLIASDKQQ